MKKRLPYLIASITLLIIEICIGAFVHDALIRPYVGDILVTILLCCLVRVVFPDRFPQLPAAVLAFATAVECVQLIDIPALNETILGIILGSTFDPADLLCYFLGCLLFSSIEALLKGRST